MKLVKRCNNNVIAPLIILLALAVRFTFQKTQFVIVATPSKKSIRNTTNAPKAPRSRGGKYHPQDAE